MKYYSHRPQPSTGRRRRKDLRHTYSLLPTRMNLWDAKRDVVEAWQVGVRVLHALEANFSAWRAAHDDGTALTPQRLLGWTRATLLLINDLVPILAPDHMWDTTADTPEAALTTDVDAVDDPLAEVWRLRALLERPTPATFGLGIGALLDQASMFEAHFDELEPEDQEALKNECGWCYILRIGEFDTDLTLLGTTLWWLLKDTVWSLGIDVEGFTRCWMASAHPAWVLDQQPLPATTDLDDLCCRLHTAIRCDTDGSPIPTPFGALIPFAVGHTGNPFADRNDWEVAEMGLTHEIWGGRFALEPVALDRWSAQSQQARRLYEDWFRWNDTLRDNPPQRITEIADMIWTAYGESGGQRGSGILPDT